MEYNIRNYSHKDFPLITSWWKEAEEPYPPTSSMLPEESTFILELDSKPVFCLSVYLTNCKEYAYLGNFISDTKLKSPYKKLASQKLMDVVLNFAGDLGYKQVICMSAVSKLQKRYQEMGFIPTISNVQTFVKRTY